MNSRFSPHLCLALCCVLLAGGAASALSAQEGRGLSVVASSLAGEETVVGRQIAVFIAVDRYREWMPLRNPVSDARAVRDALTERYYVDEVRELYDEEATRSGIVRLFERLIAETRPEDSVFLYYAGHGHLDSLSGTGSWIPQDAGLDVYEQRGWLPNGTLRGFISRMKAKHVALVSDSCFSGDILNATRSAPPVIDNEYFRRAYARRSRQVLSSGSSETVTDDSAFSRALVRALEENRKPYLDPVMLFQEIRISVTGQTPLLGSLRDTDFQEGGSFILFLRDRDGFATGTGAASGQASTAGKASYLPPRSVGRLSLALDPQDAVCAIKPVGLAGTGSGSSGGAAGGSGDGSGKGTEIPAFATAGAVELPPGIYALTIMKDGYRDLELPVSIAAGRESPVRAKLELLKPGTLVLPELGVELRLSSRGTGVNPQAVPAGVELELAITANQAVRLDVEPVKLRLGEGEVRKLEIPSGSFSFPLLGEGAEVLVGGRALDSAAPAVAAGMKGTYVSPRLPAGVYEVAVTGEFPWQGRVTVGGSGSMELPGYREAARVLLSQQRGEAERKIQGIPARRRTGVLSLVTGLAGAAGSVASWVLGRQAYESYTTSIDPAEISRAKGQVGLYGMLLPVAASVGGLGLVLSPVFFSGTNPAPFEESIRVLDEKIRALGGN